MSLTRDRKPVEVLVYEREPPHRRIWMVVRHYIRHKDGTLTWASPSWHAPYHRGQRWPHDRWRNVKS